MFHTDVASITPPSLLCSPGRMGRMLRVIRAALPAGGDGGAAGGGSAGGAQAGAGGAAQQELWRQVSSKDSRSCAP